jgi:DtxR family manganese transport transcriptional regulator
MLKKLTRYSSPVHFHQTKKQNKSELLEDYVEAIYSINQENEETRNVDLSKYFGVSQATITKNLKRLIHHGLVVSKPYRSIFLTNSGLKLAKLTKSRHEIVYNFLLSIGVSKKIAEEDSEGMEHHVSNETLLLIKKFTKKNLKDTEYF